MADFIKSGVTQAHIFINLEFVTDIEITGDHKAIHFYYTNDRRVEWKYDDEKQLEEDLNLIKHRSSDKYKSRQSGFRMS
ncbi:hypothetical protein ACTJJ0_12595 [Chitinophaga sp. 22321]|uniref:Uncharacterized protein n=1 Tax=Chitinophaga hostae TaxID=2831022 RepID=A0ABS5IWP6_9BACT|nr:hypothetical protein [Chitinophaga hostae]MBS0027369.1 hypothetical protein [Chitinophaga hostae]